MSKNVEFDKRAFDQALKAFRAHSRKAVGQVLREQAKGVLKKIVEFTPPGSHKIQGSDAKKRGESKVESDIRKLMEPGRGKELSSDSPADIHRRNRDRRGRVRRELSPKIKVRAGDLARLIREKKRMVGFLASGWRAAADKFGAKIPNWIRRHSGQGSSKEKSSSVMVEVSATNSVDYASSGDMERRVQQALNGQTRSIENQVKALAAKAAARKAGFRA